MKIQEFSEVLAQANRTVDSVDQILHPDTPMKPTEAEKKIMVKAKTDVLKARMADLSSHADQLALFNAVKKAGQAMMPIYLRLQTQVQQEQPTNVMANKAAPQPAPPGQ